MADKTKPVAQTTGKTDEIEGWIDSQVKMRKEHFEKAMKDRKEELDEKRTAEIRSIYEETQYKVDRQVLRSRKASKLEEAEKHYLAKLSIIDKDHKVTGGLLFDVIEGKHDTDSYHKAFAEIRKSYKEECNKIEEHFCEYERKLAKAYPNFQSFWDWRDE